MKLCTNCQEEHGETTKLCHVCKILKKYADQKYRRNHPDKVLASQKRYRQRHPEKVKQWTRNYENKLEAKAAAIGICKWRYEKYRASYKKMKERKGVEQ